MRAPGSTAAYLTLLLEMVQTELFARLFIKMFVLLTCLTAVDQYSYSFLQMPSMEGTTDRLCLFENSRVVVMAVKMVKNGVSHVLVNHNSPFLMCVVVLFGAKTANRIFLSFFE
jgi:hypothetical protein